MYSVTMTQIKRLRKRQKLAYRIVACEISCHHYWHSTRLITVRR